MCLFNACDAIFLNHNKTLELVFTGSKVLQRFQSLNLKHHRLKTCRKRNQAERNTR